LIPELSSGDEPDPQPEKVPAVNYKINKKTVVRLAQDKTRWRINRTVNEPEATYLILKPYRCPKTSRRYRLAAIAIPKRKFCTLTEKHLAVSFRDSGGKSHTIIFTCSEPNRLRNSHVDEIFAANTIKII
jgi:hypothetical protein